MTDIKSMFHQFYVKRIDRDLLRFLWWKDGDMQKPIVEHRMKVHLFGAVSSPGIANFGLKRAADDGEEEFGTTPEEAIDVIHQAKGVCEKAGLQLHKIISNNRKVLKSVSSDERCAR
uniref:uncharacterized protein LOC113475455 n=1 Tax=Ciona intestinalis TaxID=7719 RepID=UPI000EF47860|nr:uncharacterized protein LOC113475455 [Ciona intestinalis]|eukprot:XP_026695430.1 uncharacterized protein LOC113475455 [Ciona intestinalis]